MNFGSDSWLKTEKQKILDSQAGRIEINRKDSSASIDFGSERSKARENLLKGISEDFKTAYQVGKQQWLALGH